jgi:uncharacterized membrane protein YgcG
MKLGVAVIGFLFTALLQVPQTPAYAQAKTLEWRNLAVDARLDADGLLHIREEQAIVFTGDWNGAQRTFRLAPGQKIELKSISRVGEGGQVVPLARGNLQQVDHYGWQGANTLRWRSRLPEDPPFAATEITYVLDYTLSNILLPNSEREFLLNHDFAFAKREGPIHQFTLALELDPVWRPVSGTFSGRYARGPLPPGESFVLGLPLRFLGSRPPAAVWYGATPRFRNTLAIFLVLAVAITSLRYLVRERALGRFTAPTPASAIDPRWLDEHVFTYRPEVVGAAYDHTTSAPEVGAVMARMVAEGKIKSRVESKRGWLGPKDVLHLELVANQSELEGYEKALVTALFFDGRTTDTHRIRKHYRKSGFDPASMIQAPIEGIVRGLRGPELRSRELAVLPSILLMLSGAAGMVIAAILRHAEAGVPIIALAAGTPVAVFLGLMGYRLRQRSDAVPARTWGFLIAILGLAAGAALLVAGSASGIRSSPIVLVAAVIFVYGICRLVLSVAMSRENRAAIAIRRDFAAARNYFAQELHARAPKLKDEWIPYLIALGLGPHLDRWFRAFGGNAAGTIAAGTSGGTSSGSQGVGGGHGGGWTGGGGAFGGAGASGSWAAMGSMAAGVPSPSSSSSGGDGGGSSSGGGGGGGW